MNIGIFDSGYGGLTILKEIRNILPQYNYIYLGDNARTPYGSRSFEMVYSYTLQGVKKLFEMDCQIIIIACNTASAKALRTIQQNDLPEIFPNRRVLGVIRPTTEIIGNITESNSIGILGTVGTIQSQSYEIEINKFFPKVKVSSHACPMWVPLIENNEYESIGADYFIKKDIDIITQKDKNIDTLILACTHYPIIEDKIRSFAPEGVKVVSQGPIVAKSFKKYLERHPEQERLCKKNGSIEFLTTEKEDKFSEYASIFWGEAIKAKKILLN